MLWGTIWGSLAFRRMPTSGTEDCPPWALKLSLTQLFYISLTSSLSSSYSRLVFLPKETEMTHHTSFGHQHWVADRFCPKGLIGMGLPEEQRGQGAQPGQITRPQSSYSNTPSAGPLSLAAEVGLALTHRSQRSSRNLQVSVRKPPVGTVSSERMEPSC